MGIPLIVLCMPDPPLCHLAWNLPSAVCAAPYAGMSRPALAHLTVYAIAKCFTALLWQHAPVQCTLHWPSHWSGLCHKSYSWNGKLVTLFSIFWIHSSATTVTPALRKTLLHKCFNCVGWYVLYVPVCTCTQVWITLQMLFDSMQLFLFTSKPVFIFYGFSGFPIWFLSSPLLTFVLIPKTN